LLPKRALGPTRRRRIARIFGRKTFKTLLFVWPGIRRTEFKTAGAFLARLAGRSDQDVMTYMTIPSTISGGPSIFQVRIGSGEVLSAGDEADFLVAFYHTVTRPHRFSEGRRCPPLRFGQR